MDTLASGWRPEPDVGLTLHTSGRGAVTQRRRVGIAGNGADLPLSVRLIGSPAEASDRQMRARSCSPLFSPHRPPVAPPPLLFLAASNKMDVIWRGCRFPYPSSGLSRDVSTDINGVARGSRAAARTFLQTPPPPPPLPQLLQA